MKIVNEKGKLFGIINLADLLVLVLIVAVIAGVGVKLFGTQVQNKVAPQVDCIVEVDIIGTSPRILNEIERQDLKGERIVSGNEYLNATIEDVWFEDYIVQTPRDDGTIVNSTDPSKKDVIVKIKTTVPEGTASPKIGSQELRAGKTYIVKTQRFECSGTIRYVEIGGQAQ
ncbi:MAG: DUF4330 domain-containing protein [Anaerovoracaceae bacterium]|nr:DUF4330 domain-containing protein [Bacillota bacterium]MDY3953930.1 DUF4330 domain-containing protein [Anaerovoracaceae bacterium]